MKKRFCILGLPRSGSQLLATLLESSTRGMANLYEPFTHNLETRVKINDDNTLNYYDDTSSISIEERVECVLSALENGDKNQSLVVRFFPYSNIPNHKEIIKRIEKCNIEFVVLKRQDIEAQILSYGLALSTGVWHEFTASDLPDDLEIHHFEEMAWLYEQNKNFDNWLKSLDINYTTIHYENIVDELFEYIQRPIYRGKLIHQLKKRKTEQIWDKITNAVELKSFIQSLKDDTYIR